MSSASVLLPMVLEGHEELRISSADLRDYFYLFQITEQRLTKNLLEGSLTAEECVAVFGHPCTEFAEASGEVRVALSTLAMGDNGAVEFVQCAHLGVLYRHGVIAPDELLVPNFPPPRGLLSVGVVLDDLVLLERVVRSCGTETSHQEQSAPWSGTQRLDSVHEAYASVGLLAHPAKGSRD